MNYKDKSKLYYASSFVGYFPANQPKYSCIVVVHKPNVEAGYYGADVAGPVFKRIAQKIYTDVPSTNAIKKLESKIDKQDNSYNKMYDVQSTAVTIPNLKGMPAMDAVTILENLGLKVKLIGKGKVIKQSLEKGTAIKKNQIITLELS